MIVVDSPSPVVVVVVVADKVAHTVAVGTAVVVAVVAERERGSADRPKSMCSEGGWTRVLALYGQEKEGVDGECVRGCLKVISKYHVVM